MIEILERGDVQFFFRPTVQPAVPSDHEPPPLGVQAFFLILSPGHLHRRLRIGRKRMPERGERLWGRVERVGSLDRVLGDELEDETYTTKTRGERYQPGARPIASGCYAFVRHDDHTHFAYRLAQTEPDVPEEVALREAASHVVLFEQTEPKTGLWTTAGHPRMLDAATSELVLVGDVREPEAELGIDVLPATA